MHFPPTSTVSTTPLRRLAFDELLALQVGMVARSRQRAARARRCRSRSTTTDFDAMIDAVEAVIGEQVAARRARAGADIEADAAVALTDDQRRARWTTSAPTWPARGR